MPLSREPFFLEWDLAWRAKALGMLLLGRVVVGHGFEPQSDQEHFSSKNIHAFSIENIAIM
jgi:hypothetical protein